MADEPHDPELALSRGPAVYVQQERKAGAYVFENVAPGDYKLCVTFVKGAEPGQPRCQQLSVATGARKQEVRL